MTGIGTRKKNTIEALTCMFIGAAFLAVLLWFLRLMYVIHDDVYIRDIAAGAISGKPDFHLVYMHSLLGALLAGLYSVIPGVDWYGAGLTLLACGCFLAVLGSLLNMGYKRIRILAAWMMGVVCVGLYYLVLFQYTVTAGIAGATAIFLFGTGKKEQDTGRHPLELVGIGFLLVLTFLIRQETFLMVFPVFACMAAYEWLKDRKISHIVLLGSVIFLVGSLFAVEKAAYSDSDWKEYMRYNEARSQVFDYYGVPPYAGNEAFYGELGLEEHDVVNLDRYNVYLVDGLTGEKMEKIAALAKVRFLEQHSLKARAWNAIKTVGWGVREKQTAPLNWITALVAMGACLLCIRNHSKRLWLCGAVLALEAAFWLYLGWKGRFFWRVGACLFLVCLGVMGAVVLSELREKPLKIRLWSAKRKGILLGAVLACGMLLSGMQCYKVHKQAETQYALDSQMEALKEYCGEHPENIYFSIVGILHPYSEAFSWKWDAKVPNLMSLGDWTAFTPVTEQRLLNYGISNVPEALVTKENVYLLLTGESSAIEKSCRNGVDDLAWVQVDTVSLPDLELGVYKLVGTGE